jgi:hypothetical protein
MQSGTQMAKSSKSGIWAGRIISGLLVAFLVADALPKILRVSAVVKATAQAGYPESLVAPIGITLLTSVVFYVIPRTSVLGAILLTGYLGGATATMVRIQSPWFFLPVIFGMLAWGGVFLRDSRLRALIPLKNNLD